MDKNRLWLIGSVILMVFVLVGGVLLGIQPQLAAAAAANAQKASVQEANVGQSAVLDQLKKDFDGIDTLKAELAPLTASVPSGTGMPAFVNQLGALAGTTQVSLDGLTVADPAPYTPVEAPAVVPGTESASGSTSTSTPSPTSTTAPTPTDVVAAPAAGVPPVTSAQITAANFASLAVSVTVTGAYGNTLNFVNGLQTGERLFLVTGLTTTAEGTAEGEPSSGQVTAVISGFVYVLVPDPDATVVTDAAVG